jgi:hypothetical protein
MCCGKFPKATMTAGSYSLTTMTLEKKTKVEQVERKQILSEDACME